MMPWFVGLFGGAQRRVVSGSNPHEHQQQASMYATQVNTGQHASPPCIKQPQ